MRCNKQKCFSDEGSAWEALREINEYRRTHGNDARILTGVHECDEHGDSEVWHMTTSIRIVRKRVRRQ